MTNEEIDALLAEEPDHELDHEPPTLELFSRADAAAPWAPALTTWDVAKVRRLSRALRRQGREVWTRLQEHADGP